MLVGELAARYGASLHHWRSILLAKRACYLYSLNAVAEAWEGTRVQLVEAELLGYVIVCPLQVISL